MAGLRAQPSRPWPAARKVRVAFVCLTSALASNLAPSLQIKSRSMTDQKQRVLVLDCKVIARVVQSIGHPRPAVAWFASMAPFQR